MAFSLAVCKLVTYPNGLKFIKVCVLKVSLQLWPPFLEAATLLIPFPSVCDTGGCFVFIWGRWQVKGPLYWEGVGSGVKACLVLLPPATWAPELGELAVMVADTGAPSPPGLAWVTIGSSLQGGLGVFVQLMPILILILVSALSQLMVSSPPYSLSPRP